MAQMAIMVQSIPPLCTTANFRAFNRKLDRYFNGNGELDAWPFFSSKEYEAAKLEPSYFGKTHNE